MSRRSRQQAALDAALVFTPVGTAENTDPAPTTDPWGGRCDDTVADAVSQWLRVSGEPRQGTASLASGCDPRCSECGVLASGRLRVVAADEGWCVASLCGCENQWYTRESPFYPTPQAAQQALASGNYAV